MIWQQEIKHTNTMNGGQDDQDLIKDFEKYRAWFKARDILLSRWHQGWAKDYGGTTTGCVSGDLVPSYDSHNELLFLL